MTAARPSSASRIFISYRREDSAGHVLALLPALRRRFGSDRLVRDTDNIPPGADFVKFIRRELETCAVVLVIIGRDWLTVEDPRLRRRRLDDPADSLRIEIASALANDRIRVIPVLVERAAMPAAADLPPDLRELAYRNAIELSDARWDSDVDLLITAIERAGSAEAAAPAPSRPELPDLKRRRRREIEAQLTSARDALRTKDYDAALWVCEKALLLDPQNGEALDLLDRARKAIDEHKIDGWLHDARAALAAGDMANASDLVDQVLAVDSTSNEALTLRREMLALRREREQDRERKRQPDGEIARTRDPVPPQVLLGVSAPREVNTGTTFVARFVAYVEAVELAVKRRLHDLDAESTRGGVQTALGLAPAGGGRWRAGTPVEVRVSGPYVSAEPPTQSFEWNGRENLVSFVVTVADDAPGTGIQMSFEVFIEGVSVAFIPLNLRVGGRTDQTINTVTARPASTAFASYASQDASLVALCLSALKRWDPQLDVFMDCLDLTPNESWQRELERIIPTRDAFLLFWSVNAMNSKWVAWELQIAATTKGLDCVRPMPIDDPEVAPPPEALKHLHFRDRYMLARQGFLRLARRQD